MHRTLKRVEPQDGAALRVRSMVDADTTADREKTPPAQSEYPAMPPRTVGAERAVLKRAPVVSLGLN